MSLQIKIESSKIDELIAAAGDPVKFIIADGVEYGIYQEFSHAAGGRPRMGGKGVTGPGHPSLVPAFEKVVKQFIPALAQAIERIVPLESVVRKAAFDIQALWAGDVNVDTGAYKNSIHVEK